MSELHGSLPASRLLAMQDDIQPSEYELTEESCQIGRLSPCQIVVPRSIVSRLHARVQRDGPRYLLQDLGSSNGTFVNGRRIHQTHLLTNRDTIGLGAATAMLRFVDPEATEVPVGQIRYHEQLMLFYLGQDPIDLPPTQFRLLRHLYHHAGEVCTREQCAEAIWGSDYAPGLDADALDRTISNLRGHLRRLNPRADLIKTRPGQGYLLDV